MAKQQFLHELSTPKKVLCVIAASLFIGGGIMGAYQASSGSTTPSPTARSTLTK